MRISAQGAYDSLEATLINACSKSGGRSFPRFAARRRIPSHAFLLKKYRGGRLPVSRISDKEDSTTPLGHSEVLSVTDSVCPPIPELAQRPDDGTKVPSSTATEDTGDVFPEDPLGTVVLNHFAKDEGEVSSGIFHSFPQSRD
jgi:hypothetical protein